MSYIKAKYITKGLPGLWEVTYKIDGVRAFKDSAGNVTSRNGKPLYNLDHLEFTDAEIFRDNWETTVSLVRTQSHMEVTQDDVYPLDIADPRLTPNLFLGDPSFEKIMEEMEEAVKLGYEGIVLRQGDKWMKAVPVQTEDIKITGYVMGKGKYEGLLGAWVTEHGNVGSGLTDEQRKFFTSEGLDNYIGTYIEVEFRERTPAGKLRFPRFVRMREDK